MNSIMASFVSMKRVNQHLLLICLLLGFRPISILGNEFMSIEISIHKQSSEAGDLLIKARKIFKDKPEKAVDLVSEAILIGIQSNNRSIQVNGYQLLGEIHLSVNEYSLAISNFRKALSLEQSTSLGSKISRSSTPSIPEKKYQLFRQLATALDKDGQLDPALEYYNKFLLEKYGHISRQDSKTDGKKISKRRKSKSEDDYLSSEEFLEVQLAISSIYNRKKNFSISRRNILSNNVITKDSGTFDEVLLNNTASYNLKAGEILSEQGDSLAIQYYDNSYRQAKENSQPAIASKAIDKMAKILADTDRKEESRDLRTEGIGILKDLDDKQAEADQYLELGKLDQDLGENDSAEFAFRKAIAIGKDLGDIDLQQRSLRELAKLAEKNGDLAEASSIYQEYYELQDSAMALKEQQIEQRLALITSLSKKQQHVDLLEKNEQLNSKTIEILQKEAETQKVLIYSLLFGLVLLAVLGYLMYNNLKQRRIANQLIALRSLRSQMNPHFIFNALNSVNLYIAQKDERTANKYLTDFSKLMRSVLEQSQKDFISLQKELEMIALYIRLEHDRFKDKFDFQLEIDSELDQENINIPPMLIQPYIENAIWHGLRYKEDFGHLLVKYYQKENNVVVLIKDDGIGREQSELLKTKNQLKTESTGMFNIESRLKIINNMYKTNIEITVSDPIGGKGTQVEVIIPLQTNNIV